MSDLDRLFYWRGITADYLNYRGERVNVPLDNRVTLLKAMGVDVSTPKAIEEEAYELDVKPWKDWFSSLTMAPAGPDCHFEINLKPEDQEPELQWKVTDLNGKPIKAGHFKYDDIEETGEYIHHGIKYSRRKVLLGDLPPNYYDLSVRSLNKVEKTRLAVFPPTVHQAHWSNVGEKVWGVIIQLYTLRSERNWGIGDFTDLRELIEKMAQKGADVIGLNPLHTLSPYLEDYYSPYSPSDRRFINPLYIDPYWIAEYTENVKTSVDKELLSECRGDKNVDYVKQRKLKYPIFQQMFDVFVEKEMAHRSERYLKFENFVREQGDALLGFAFYEACKQDWPGATYVLRYGEKYEDVVKGILEDKKPSGAALAVFFHCYLQWLSFTQLDACQQAAITSGMKVGLIRDLAVGADGGGAEVESNNELYCRASAIGAPPDPFAQTGQNWGLPPVIPSELRRSGFEHFINLLRTNMASCGALRIDHAMSLMRLWWVPPGLTADHGAYVYYPFYEMLGLLSLESYLNECLVIGEDLGVVPDEFREALTRTQIFTNKVFYFEKVFHDKFKKPEDYDAHALAMVNNHDVPTLVSWWNGTDLELRDELNLLEEGVDYQTICQQRAHDKANLMELLFESGLYPESWHGRDLDTPIDEDLVEAILLLTSRTASKIYVLQLEDLLMMDEPVNVPGTFKEHDNWQRKLTSTLSMIFESKRINNVLDKVNEQRKQ